MKPIELIDKTKAYQFIKQTQSRNTIDKLVLKEDKKSLNKLLKVIENWQKWHLSKLAYQLKSGRGKNNKFISAAPDRAGIHSVPSAKDRCENHGD